LLAIVASVDASHIEAVVKDRLSICLAKKPLRMGIENSLIGLAETEFDAGFL